MNYKFKTKPYKHQLKSFRSFPGRNLILPILWKWVPVNLKFLLDNIAMLYDQGKINGALIVAPKGVIGTWYDQEIPTALS